MGHLNDKMWTVYGLAETYKLMDDLTSKEKQNIILGILRKTANKEVKKPMQDANRFKTSKKQPSKQAIITTNDKDNPLAIKVGVSGKFFYLRFAEFGTKKRTTYHKALAARARKSGKKSKAIVRRVGNKANRGIMPKMNNLYETIENQIDNALNYFVANYAKETKERWAKMVRKRTANS
jgi:HK97 gp10 family phage protein